jgi:hypothetical protein
MSAIFLIATLFVFSLSVSAGIAFACLRSAVWFTCRRG